MTSPDLALTSAVEQAKLVETGQISPLELTQFYLERIERLDPKLGSFVTVAVERAIAEAQEKTAKRNDPNTVIDPQTQTRRPFFGVPIAIKDLNAVAGLPQMCGTLALKDNIPQQDDVVVEKIKAAGFIILGKTATSELGSFPYIEPQGMPPTRNPWNLEYTAGGSSGGSAAAVAAGFCPIAQGSDGGGSIRTPASCCGLIGVKPSRGRVSSVPTESDSGIATNGVLAHTVADAAALLDVMTGNAPSDRFWLPEPLMPFAEAVQQPLNSLKIAFTSTIEPIGKASEVCQQALKTALTQLEHQGHQITEINLNLGELQEPFLCVWQSEIASAGLPPEVLSPMNQWLFQQAQASGNGKYLQAVFALQNSFRKFSKLFKSYDVLMLPVHLHSPPKVGEWANLSPPETLKKIIQWIAPCPMANALGLPAIALPVMLNEQGVPISIQLIGTTSSEGLLFQVAAQLEKILPVLGKPKIG